MSLIDLIKNAIKPSEKTGQAQKAATTTATATATETEAETKTKTETEIETEIETQTEIETAITIITAAEANKEQETAPGVDKSSKTQALARLAPREAEVFAHCLNGTKMKDIAEEMRIKTSTVNGYCREIYKKLGVNSKAQLIIKYAGVYKKPAD